MWLNPACLLGVSTSSGRYHSASLSTDAAEAGDLLCGFGAVVKSDRDVISGMPVDRDEDGEFDIQQGSSIGAVAVLPWFSRNRSEVISSTARKAVT